eukprot:TRINITY_DN1744_c0_g1_i1.p1 TRINITY_DN1744_c0_g1~~TRINITY_DN1744_c0_g1_i1.p1  ORF type:complete len:302 (-),score=45.81 TRINITY_DN1744_c0_g1_i1:29-934(-)
MISSLRKLLRSPFVRGAVAGFAEVSATYAIDVTRIRHQIIRTQRAVAQDAKHSDSDRDGRDGRDGRRRGPIQAEWGLGDTLRVLWAEGGIAAFYRGFATRASMVAPMRAMFWSTNTFMGKALSNTTLGPLSRSVITGLACGSANFGLDAIQELRRMAILTQSLKEKENGKPISIPRENFILSSGVIPHYLRNMVFAVTMSIGTNYRKDLFGYTFWQQRARTVGSTIAAIFLSQPFDTCKTMMQKRYSTGTGPKVNSETILKMLSNPSVIYSGFVPRCFAGCISVSVGELVVLGLTKFANGN